jgi:uncharacterized paraquat-inducible protein A
MIRMQLPWLVFTALFIFLAGILIVWIGYEIARRRRVTERHRHWIRCAVCSFHFKANPTEKLPICPQCGSSNEHIPAPLI